MSSTNQFKLYVNYSYMISFYTSHINSLMLATL